MLITILNSARHLIGSHWAKSKVTTLTELTELTEDTISTSQRATAANF